MPFWAAGWWGLSGLRPGLGGFLGASGPLDGVDHWRGAFPGFRPGSGIFPGASGPLAGVDHWLETFPCFFPVSGLFWGASGPLGGVDHWRGALPRFGSVFGGCLERFLAITTTYLRESAGYYGGLLERIGWLADLVPLFIYYIDK